MSNENWVWLLVLSEPTEAWGLLRYDYFDDNGGVPDGSAWLCESSDVERDDLRRIVDADVGYLALGLKYDYDGTDDDWRRMYNRFCDHWCGYDSRGVAYGLPGQVKERA